MSLGSWIFVAFYLLGLLAMLIGWVAITLVFWLVRQALKLLRTEHIGVVAEHIYSIPRVEEVWLHSCPMHADPFTSFGMTDPPILVRRNVPALPFIGIRLADGSYYPHECTAGEYDAWKDGAFVQIDVYAIGGWRLYTTEPKLVA